MPSKRTLSSLARAVQDCRGCELYQHATQAVFGEGGARAPLVLVGEQPGDREDLEGRPFVGPAGKVLEDALAEVGIRRKDVYLTNAVKHFKWTPRGKRRLHSKPSARELKACRPWIEAELAVIRPRIIVCLGATATECILGPSFRVTRDRGVFHASPWADLVLATYHPSALLRAPNSDRRQQLFKSFLDDLRQVQSQLVKT